MLKGSFLLLFISGKQLDAAERLDEGVEKTKGAHPASQCGGWC